MRYFEPRFIYKDTKRILKFEHYSVEEKSKNYTGIYDRCGCLITSRETFKSACKVAKLLEQAYIEGYNNG